MVEHSSKILASGKESHHHMLLDKYSTDIICHSKFKTTFFFYLIRELRHNIVNMDHKLT